MRKTNTALRTELKQQRHVVFGNYRYWFHIIIWSLVMLYTGIYYGESVKGFNDGLMIGGKPRVGAVGILGTSVSVAGILWGSLLAACMVYFFLLIAIPYARYKKQKRYLIIGFAVNVFVWIVILCIAGFVVGYTQVTHDNTSKSTAIFVAYVAIFSLILSSYFFAFYYFIDLYDQQKNLARLQTVLTEKLQAETNFLRTQINPHFLFNTLNNIYSLTLHKSDDAPRITVQLKDLISYMVKDSANDLVPLAGEIDFLKNYIALEQLRNKQENISIDLEVQGAPGNRQIAPLILINFIENAFKHGVKAGIDHSFVKIRLYVMDQVLALDVTNTMPKEIAVGQSITHTGGIGINNVKRRLALLYPNKHKLSINQSATAFRVHLTINL